MHRLKCGCQFAIVFQYQIPSFENLEDPFGDRLRNEKDRHTAEQKAVIISESSCYDHTNGCNPSYQQSVMQKKAAGTLFDKESKMMDYLLTVMELADKNLDNHHLRTELKLINPSRSHITSMQLNNFCL